MTVAGTTEDALRERADAVDALVARARDALTDGDATGCGWRARTAAEAMLRLWADAHEVPLRAEGGKPVTLEVLRVALRHARLLDRRTEDLIAHVQNVGNRAAHAPPSDRVAVDLDEARTVVPALELAWASIRRDLDLDVPAAPPAPSSGAPWWPWIAAPIGFVAVFALVVAAPGGTVDGAPADDAVPLVDAGALEALLADAPEQPRLTPDDGADRVVATVRGGRALSETDLAPLTCTELQWARAWVWATHGYAFASEAARQHFAQAPGYEPAPHRTRRDVEAAFSEVDAANLDRLSTTMLERGCPCPRPLQRRAPCPD